jgi:demethylmenaquinone methyltransferase/2-methoxy-6-polyprenyl-1,4-benzoquinol methylase
VFDAAAIGFSLRNIAAPTDNLSSVVELLEEMARVVRRGGWVVSLETSQPKSGVLRTVYHAYVRFAVSLAPLLSEGAAYRYLLRTVLRFPPADGVAELFRAAGLEEVSYTNLLFGAAAIHVGRVA